MNTNHLPTSPPIQHSRIGVMLHRHLQMELGLLEQLESLNKALTTALNEGGVNGPALETSEALAGVSERLEQEAIRVRKQRTVVLASINEDLPADATPLTIRQYIEASSAETRKTLGALRHQILDRLTEVHANMLGNQAVMFYSYDFNKRIVSGLMGSDVDESQYGVDGHAQGVRPGNIIRKVC